MHNKSLFALNCNKIHGTCIESDGMERFYLVTQDDVQFGTYESFISGIFHLIISSCDNPPKISQFFFKPFYRK